MSNSEIGSNLVEADIIDLTHDAHGVIDLRGERVFVPGALPGERARLTLRRRRRRYRDADLLEILQRAPERVEPSCEYFGRCGGCAVQHLSYAAQVKFKEGVVREALRRVAGLEAEDWLPPLLGPQWHYRRKARLGIRYVEGKGRVLVGFKERASRLVTDMLHCPVLIEPFDTLPGALSEVLGHTTLRAHVPQAEIAVGDSSSAIVLRVLRTPAPDDIAALSALGTALDCDMYLQPGGPGTVEPIDRTSARPLSYRLPAFDVDLQFAPTDFIQVNGKVNAALVSRVVDGLQIEHGDRVLDLYCGIGNFSIALAQRAGTVTGIEGDAGLVARAARNAQHNGIDAARFMTADLTQADWPFLRTPWDLVVLDPPRSGAEDVVGALWRLRPRRIAYVSCHPATLARDARVLAGGGAYRLKAVGIADMFPNTHHVETVALFEAA